MCPQVSDGAQASSRSHPPRGEIGKVRAQVHPRPPPPRVLPPPPLRPPVMATAAPAAPRPFRCAACAASCRTRRTRLAPRSRKQRQPRPGLFRGLSASIFAFGPASAVWWAMYEGTNRNLVAWRSSLKSPATGTPCAEGTIEEGDNDGHAVWIDAVSGLVAGCASSILTNPLDIAKTRLQAQHCLLHEFQLEHTTAGGGGGSAAAATATAAAGGAEIARSSAVQSMWRSLAVGAVPPPRRDQSERLKRVSSRIQAEIRESKGLRGANAATTMAAGGAVLDQYFEGRSAEFPDEPPWSADELARHVLRCAKPRSSSRPIHHPQQLEQLLSRRSRRGCGHPGDAGRRHHAQGERVGQRPEHCRPVLLSLPITAFGTCPDSGPCILH